MVIALVRVFRLFISVIWLDRYYSLNIISIQNSNIYYYIDFSIQMNAKYRVIWIRGMGKPITFPSWLYRQYRKRIVWNDVLTNNVQSWVVTFLCHVVGVLDVYSLKLSNKTYNCLVIYLDQTSIIIDITTKTMLFRVLI